MRSTGPALAPPAGPAARPPGSDAWTNTALGVLLVLAAASGLAAFAFGTPLVGRWVVVLHGAAGIGLLVLARRKGRIVRRSLGRPRRRPGSSASLVLAALVLVTVATGLVHGAGLTDRIGPLTLMQVHVGAAVLTVPLAVRHYRTRPGRSRRPGPGAPDAQRRALLRGVAVTAASGAALAAWEGGLALADAPGAHRRFTGSHEVGSGDPAAFPVTQWLDDRVQRLDAGSWRLETGGRRLTLAVLREMPQDDVGAVLDCTGGWWSEQQWRGVRLDRIVDLGDARSARVTCTRRSGGSAPSAR